MEKPLRINEIYDKTRKIYAAYRQILAIIRMDEYK